ncbi:MAG TPA: radical SAM protein [Vicinamibacterales bacterium]|nr:radical SAM protein [Vicinamibacterales bacterium]
MDTVIAAAAIDLRHLDNLWIQVSGTRCNIQCRHCFNSSGPHQTSFDLMTLDAVRQAIASAAALGVRDIYFTGGEPFLHPQLVEMVAYALTLAPTTVLTNGMLISDRIADMLATLAAAARYSLEVRVSLDGHTEEMNDAIRGRGVFRLALAGAVKLARRNLLPLITIVRTWDDGDELATLAAFTRVLKDAGCDRPRLKLLPALPLGRELTHLGRVQRDECVTTAMLEDFDRDLLMCANSRLVTDRGVWVCPLLVEQRDARLGTTLDDAARSYTLRHEACVTCWRYGTICGNVSATIEGPVISAAPEVR